MANLLGNLAKKIVYSIWLQKYIFFHFENYNFHVFKSLYIFKVMLEFNREILINLTRNMVMLNVLN